MAVSRQTNTPQCTRMGPSLHTARLGCTLAKDTQREVSYVAEDHTEGIMRDRDKSLAERFWSKVDKSGKCWLWTGDAVGAKGKAYGRLRANGVKTLASHVAWFLHTGVWPTLNVLHKCDNPPCVRFSHLFQGNTTINMQDMIAKGRAVHPNGEANGQSKLTAKQVQSIRRLDSSQRSIAAIFGVSQSLIWAIKAQKIWRHL